ncbi:MAG: amino acid permease [Candidatus Marinimicrobia bacterium]|nr:amino acid permease [Candidatus Neomarinimicrobiota bacterium]MCF7880290.1 amino acid permease [Candidatus Neomarinimicrobiota bacterium]
MAQQVGPKDTLEKHLKLPAVIAFGIGPMLSSGVFLLPGMVYGKVGPAGILAYIVAGLLILPSLMSKAELATAMPRAGGTYYFLDRSMGPLIGTISGFGTWLSLSFKAAFELIGLGAYLVIFFHLPVKPVAIALCVVFGVLNISGVKNVGRVQAILVSILLGILAYFTARGFLHIDADSYTPFFVKGSDSFLAAVGFVFVGFAGLTKIASVAEEVDNLERNIPLGMILALFISLIIYVLVMIVLVGTVPAETLKNTLTPLTDSAQGFMGLAGKILLAAGAVLAFIASANVGITAASRYPLAMSRDNLMAPVFKKLGRFQTPTNSIIFTISVMILFIIILSPEGIAKVASAFKLLIFGLVNLAVVAMRESKIESYDPSFKSLWYPWPQIIGILAPIVLIPFLGAIPLFFSGGIVVFGILWYFFYGQKRVERSGAMTHVFQRLGRAATPQLDQELRQILREKGLRKEDEFEESILTASILFHEPKDSYDKILRRASGALAEKLGLSDETIYEALSKTNQMGDTPIGKHIALPHARLENVDTHGLVIVHSREGVEVDESSAAIHALFILISPKEDPGEHLRFLAELANRAEGLDFGGEWRYLTSQDDIRNQFVRSGEVTEVTLTESRFIGKRISDIQVHDQCLIALINRQNSMIVPHGSTTLEQGDRLTIIGDEKAVQEMERYILGQGNKG